MDFLRCTQIIHKSKFFNAHISKKSTTGWFAPCAKTPNLDQYIPQTSYKRITDYSSPNIPDPIQLGPHKTGTKMTRLKFTRPRFIRQLGPHIYFITKYSQLAQRLLCLRMYKLEGLNRFNGANLTLNSDVDQDT